MIILPDKNILKSRFLMPVPKKEWYPSSQVQQKNVFGHENIVKFSATGRLNDGKKVWKGWFDDRDDFDAFIYAFFVNRLRYERFLWSLPKPNWHLDLGEHLTYTFATDTFLVTTSSSNQTWTVPTDWNNSDNQIHTIGAGDRGRRYGVSGSITSIGTGGNYGARSGGSVNSQASGAVNLFQSATPGMIYISYTPSPPIGGFNMPMLGM